MGNAQTIFLCHKTMEKKCCSGCEQNLQPRTVPFSHLNLRSKNKMHPGRKRAKMRKLCEAFEDLKRLGQTCVVVERNPNITKGSVAEPITFKFIDTFSSPSDDSHI